MRIVRGLGEKKTDQKPDDTPKFKKPVQVNTGSGALRILPNKERSSVDYLFMDFRRDCDVASLLAEDDL